MPNAHDGVLDYFTLLHVKSSKIFCMADFVLLSAIQFYSMLYAMYTVDIIGRMQLCCILVNFKLLTTLTVQK